VVDRRDVELADHLGALQILAVMDVLDHHHADELLMLMVMVEGELDQAAERLDWRQALYVELGLALAHQPVGILQGAEIEALLVAEIVIDHALRRAGARRDLVDASPR
jgi:hypothetical protein